jgi:hypothetical protein
LNLHDLKVFIKKILYDEGLIGKDSFTDKDRVYLDEKTISALEADVVMIVDTE